MRTIHLVYPNGPGISAPETIGRHLQAALSTRYNVKTYQWDEVGAIHPGADDVLLGHPHPIWGTRFRASAKQPGWSRTLMMCPFNNASEYMGYVEPVLRNCDLYLAITGQYWFDRVEEGPFAHWRTKMRHLDLAVDRREYPPIKADFALPGRRRFAYIGNTAEYKNTAYLSRIAWAMPEAEIWWIGEGGKIPGVKAMGRADFSTLEGRAFARQVDFLLTVGSHDANPTTILEAMAWGIVPVCSRQSGYDREPGIVNVPLDDLQATVGILRRLQMEPDRELRRRQATNWDAVDARYNWNRFGRTVVQAIEELQLAPDAAYAPPLRDRWNTRFKALSGPVSPFRGALWKGLLLNMARQRWPRLIQLRDKYRRSRR